MPNELNVEAWIQSFYNYDQLELQKIKNIKSFMLLWNMFEGLMCGTNAKPDIISNAVIQLHNQKPLDTSEFDDLLNYAINMFTRSSDGEISGNFNALKFRHQASEELVKKVLKAELTDEVSIIKALLLICYRLRNNLFHGLKKITNLRSYDEYFLLANKLLMKVLDLYKAANPI